MDTNVQRLKAALQAGNYSAVLYLIESYEKHAYRLLWFEREKPTNIIIQNAIFLDLLDEQAWILTSKELHKRYHFSIIFFSLLIIGSSLLPFIEPDNIFYLTFAFLGMFIGIFMLVSSIQYHHKMLNT